MRTTFTAAVLLAIPVAAWADKYGIDEAISESGSVPSWLLPVMFLALLAYHLHDHSKLDGQRARESYQHEQTSSKLSKARIDLAAAQKEIAVVNAKYQGLHAAVQKHFEGVTTDKEFTDAVEPYLDPIEYTVYKKPEA